MHPPDTPPTQAAAATPAAPPTPAAGGAVGSSGEGVKEGEEGEDGEGKGAVPVNNGGVCANFRWMQTLQDLQVSVPVPKGTKAKGMTAWPAGAEAPSFAAPQLTTPGLLGRDSPAWLCWARRQGEQLRVSS